MIPVWKNETNLNDVKRRWLSLGQIRNKGKESEDVQLEIVRMRGLTYLKYRTLVVVTIFPLDKIAIPN
jgi:hypothetical protein